MLYKYGHSEKNAMLNTLIFLWTKVRNIFYSCNSWQEIYLGDKYLFVFLDGARSVSTALPFFYITSLHG